MKVDLLSFGGGLIAESAHFFPELGDAFAQLVLLSVLRLPPQLEEFRSPARTRPIFSVPA